MSVFLKAEILNFGNELLIGRVVNSNASWLAKELTSLGLNVIQITMLSDELSEIKRGFTEVFARNADIIISTGGLGPTWDDKTAEGLSLALDVSLVENKIALEMIMKRYNALGAKINISSKKMADLPIGTTPLFNSVGTAPGIRIQHNKTVLYCVPGVPSEMKAIYYEHIAKEIETIKDKPQYFQHEFRIEGIGESRLAHLTSELTNQYPQIYIKSHPTHETTTSGIKSIIAFHITAYGDEKTKKLLDSVTNKLKSQLVDIGAELI